MPRERAKKNLRQSLSFPIRKDGNEGGLLDAAVGRRRRYASKVWKPMEDRRPSSGGRRRVSTCSSSSFDLIILVSRLAPLLVDTVGVVLLFPLRLGHGL